MKLIETRLRGAYVIELDMLCDERGFFARSFCQDDFKKYNLEFSIVQCNVSQNKNKGTLRGMHFQSAPFQEAKLVSCTKGAIYDVIIDLRPDSITYCEWFAIELHSEDYQLLYIPEGFAHGFQTLEDDSVVFYQMSETYHSEFARGIKWNDPVFNIKWPEIEPRVISEKDRFYTDFQKDKDFIS
ncbi:dTDP-4-dehydrorhamnose 3,5-epimerase [bacterium]|nr:dTDP-4-dehydrorhamnose 3,5-epimerase [bacterium]